MKLEERLHELRKKEGLTQAQVAEAIGVSRQAVSKWESGTASPSLDNLNSLSILYGVSIDRVVGKEELAGAEPLEEASLEEEPPLDADASLDNLPPLPTPSSRCCRRKENPLTKKTLASILRWDPRCIARCDYSCYSDSFQIQFKR